MERTMNIFLSHLVHFYHKLQSYHWYVQGKTFFQSHAKLEEYYNFVNGQIDELAELMLMDGKKPVSTMKGFAELTTIKDPAGDFVQDMHAVFSDVLADFETLHACARLLKEKADAENDTLVSAKMDGFLEEYAKILWMLRSTLA